ncbi:hypothetical protein KY363_04570 [Candidatus Woesearchaeota archaeon]|nr:hypothetical protein [Candidatus Woesearchaeota archaeon]
MGLTGLARLIVAVYAAAALGCAHMPKTEVKLDVPAEMSGCSMMSYDPKELFFSCDGIRYDLFQKPVMEDRKYDILEGRARTIRHFAVESEGKKYTFITEQTNDEKYPCRVILETKKGQIGLELDSTGKIISMNNASGYGF